MVIARLLKVFLFLSMKLNFEFQSLKVRKIISSLMKVSSNLIRYACQTNDRRDFQTRRERV